MCESPDIPEYDMPERNRLAGVLVSEMAADHFLPDLGLGLVGFVPIPGAGAMAITSAISRRIPDYKRLAKKLALIYQAPMDEIKLMTTSDGRMDWDRRSETNNYGIDVSFEEFLQKSLCRLAIGLVAVSPLVVGGVLSVAISACLSRVVGTMVSIYFQNRSAWVGDSATTFKLSMEIATSESRVDFQLLYRRVSQVQECQVGQLLAIIRHIDRQVRQKNLKYSDDDVLRSLEKRGVPNDMAQEVLRRFREES